MIKAGGSRAMLSKAAKPFSARATVQRVLGVHARVALQSLFIAGG